MPEYDAFGRETEPDAARTATPAVEARPADDDAGTGYGRPRRRRRGGPLYVLVCFALAIGLFVVSYAGGGSDTRGGSSTTLADVKDSTDELRKSFEQLQPDPDAPSALTAEGAEKPLGAVRDEEADGPPAFVSFTADEVLAGLLIKRRWFAMVSARGQAFTNGLPLREPPALDARRVPWDDVDLAVLDRVVEASGGAKRVERAFVTAQTRAPRWIVQRKDGSERRYDLSGRRVSP